MTEHFHEADSDLACFICSVCSRQYLTELGLNNHMFQRHPWRQEHSPIDNRSLLHIPVQFPAKRRPPNASRGGPSGGGGGGGAAGQADYSVESLSDEVFMDGQSSQSSHSYPDENMSAPLPETGSAASRRMRSHKQSMGSRPKAIPSGGAAAFLSQPDLMMMERRPWYNDPDYRGPRPENEKLLSARRPMHNIYRGIGQAHTYQTGSARDLAPGTPGFVHKNGVEIRYHPSPIASPMPSGILGRKSRFNEDLFEDDDGVGSYSQSNDSDILHELVARLSSTESQMQQLKRKVDQQEKAQQRRSGSGLSPRFASITSSSDPHQVSNALVEEPIIVPQVAQQANAFLVRPIRTPLAQRKPNSKLSPFPHRSQMVSASDNNLHLMNNNNLWEMRTAGAATPAPRALRKLSPFSSNSSLASRKNSANLEMITRNLTQSSLRGVPSVQQSSEILFCVFAYLDTKSLALAGRVCQQWYHISRQPSLWRNIHFDDVKLIAKHLQTICCWSTEVTHLCFENLKSSSMMPNPSISRSNGQGSRKLPVSSTAGDLTGSQTTGQNEKFQTAFENLLRQNSKTLISLKMIDCKTELNERSVWLATIHCPRLTKLVYFSDQEPLGPEVLWALGKGCPKLTSLSIPPKYPNRQPQKFDDRCCQIVAQNWPMIQVLGIGGKKITEAGLIAIAAGCPKLRYLELDHGPEISEALAVNLVKHGLRGLERLDFCFTPITPRAIMQLNSACPKLIHIGVQAGVTDFYPLGATDQERRDYATLVDLFKKLQARPGFQQVLELKLDKP